jgi:hypothetical protein
MSKHALQIALGAKTAELHAALKHQDQLKSQVVALEKRAKDAAASLKASFQRIGFNLSDDPSAQELEAARAFMDGYSVRQKQIVDQMVAAMGFGPDPVH